MKRKKAIKHLRKILRAVKRSGKRGTVEVNEPGLRFRWNAECVVIDRPTEVTLVEPVDRWLTDPDRWFVDPQNGNDAWTGRAEVHEPHTLKGPLRTWAELRDRMRGTATT